MKPKFDEFLSCILCDRQQDEGDKPLQMEIRNNVGVCVECTKRSQDDGRGVGEALESFLQSEDYGLPAIDWSEERNELPDTWIEVKCGCCGASGFGKEDLFVTGLASSGGSDMKVLSYGCRGCITRHKVIYGYFYLDWLQMVKKTRDPTEDSILAPEYVADFWKFYQAALEKYPQKTKIKRDLRKELH